MDRRTFVKITTGGKTTYYSELPAEGETELWEIVNVKDTSNICLMG